MSSIAMYGVRLGDFRVKKGQGALLEQTAILGSAVIHDVSKLAGPVRSKRDKVALPIKVGCLHAHS
jgi:hypothetical protein